MSRLCLLLLLSFSATFCKYVLVQKRKTWYEAQEYCRLHHTDLASVSNQNDMRRLQRLVIYLDYYWIGLVRSSTSSEKWMWSGGGEVTRFFWALGQPQNGSGEDYGMIDYFGWHDAMPYYQAPFFCYDAVVVRRRKTWEDALDFCREHHRDLASVESKTEMLLIGSELDKNETTDQVWIGLHFFPGDWLWVDGRPLKYEGWGQEGGPACPEFKLECAALSVMGSSANATALTEDVQTGHTQKRGSVGHFGVSDPAPVKKLVWEAHNCDESLHFVCY